MVCLRPERRLVHGKRLRGKFWTLYAYKNLQCQLVKCGEGAARTGRGSGLGSIRHIGSEGTLHKRMYMQCGVSPDTAGRQKGWAIGSLIVGMEKHGHGQIKPLRSDL